MKRATPPATHIAASVKQFPFKSRGRLYYGDHRSGERKQIGVGPVNAGQPMAGGA